MSLTHSKVARSAWLFAFLAVAGPRLVRAQEVALAGIAHAAFRVSDVQKSREFYLKLGFQQAFEFGDEGKTSVSYIKINDQQFVELYQRKDDAQPLGLLHVCFESRDLNALHDAYVARGLSPTAVRKAHAGNLLSVLHDPGGQTIEFTQYLPGSLHSQQKGKLLGAQRVSDRILRVKELVKDIQPEQDFYASRLGFEQAEAKPVLLRLPGDSGEEIELARSAAGQKSGIVLGVESVGHLTERLHGLGIAAHRDDGGVAITDPDGNVVLFVASPGGPKKD